MYALLICLVPVLWNRTIWTSWLDLDINVFIAVFANAGVTAAWRGVEPPSRIPLVTLNVPGRM